MPAQLISVRVVYHEPSLETSTTRKERPPSDVTAISSPLAMTQFRGVEQDSAGSRGPMGAKAGMSADCHERPPSEVETTTTESSASPAMNSEPMT